MLYVFGVDYRISAVQMRQRRRWTSAVAAENAAAATWSLPTYPGNSNLSIICESPPFLFFPSQHDPICFFLLHTKSFWSSSRVLRSSSPTTTRPLRSPATVQTPSTRGKQNLYVFILCGMKLWKSCQPPSAFKQKIHHDFYFIGFDCVEGFC